MTKQRTYNEQTPTMVGQTVTIAGWVHARRDHGGLIFCDIRDASGLLQVVVHPDQPEAFVLAEQLRDEFVVEITGELTQRDPALVNDKLPTGGIELVAQTIRILNRSAALPIQPFSDNQAGEELRLKYRYLDLRRPKMQQMLRARAAYYAAIRSYMEAHQFTEVATPILANSSPEGARDFLVPSRVHPGTVYALPQAPQQFKQLLMVGGVDRYYQIATCFRDEDPRADRLYGDFYQLDVEMAFVEDGEQVRQTMEPLMKQLVADHGKQLMTEDIPRISYQEAMDTYGTDKPDLRYDMRLIDVTDVFTDSAFGVFAKSAQQGGVVKAIRVAGAHGLTRKQIDIFTELAKKEGAAGLAYLLFDDEGNVKSPIAKFMSELELTQLRERLQVQPGDGVFFAADTRKKANAVLGALRVAFAQHFGLADDSVVALAWIVDFPFYEWDESQQKIDFGHNPFSMPRGGVEAITQATSDEAKLAIVADQYDMVMNGYEICSGAVRNHSPEVMEAAFGALGYDSAYVAEKFGAMLQAFTYGAPPHAGCAFGLDRIFMVLTGEHNIREVVAFPKNGSGVDVMMASPATPDPEQLKELGVTINVSTEE